MKLQIELETNPNKAHITKSVEPEPILSVSSPFPLELIQDIIIDSLNKVQPDYEYYDYQCRSNGKSYRLKLSYETKCVYESIFLASSYQPDFHSRGSVDGVIKQVQDTLSRLIDGLLFMSKDKTELLRIKHRKEKEFMKAAMQYLEEPVNENFLMAQYLENRHD